MLVPIRPDVDASDVLAFAQAVVQKVAAAHPKDTTVEHSIAARKGRVYLDPFRKRLRPDGRRAILGSPSTTGTRFDAPGLERSEVRPRSGQFQHG